MLKKTKIVCTLGPSSNTPEIIEKMIKAGMNVARFNFSHGSHEEHKQRIDMVRAASQKLGIPVALLLDTKGPEIRLGKFKNGSIMMEAGKDFTLTARDVEGQDIHTKILNSGKMSDRKRVAVPGIAINLPAVSDTDADDIEFGCRMNMDWIAASFIQRGKDVLTIRKILEKHDSHMKIISKIECQAAVNNIDDIIKMSDGIMVARGDLGVEVPAEEVPMLQKVLIHKCQAAGKPVITATQMLESMCNNPRPTRAETSDVANAILDGTDAIMLSGETAGGLYPVEAVETMARVATFTESNFTPKSYEDVDAESATTTESIGKAVVKIAQDLHAAAIIASTERGGTAQMISKFRPACPIVAVSPHEAIVRRLQLNWGVQAVTGKEASDTDAVVDNAIFAALDNDLIKAGDLVVLTAGVPVAKAGSTNMIRVQVVGDILLRGTGIGRNSAIGKVCIAESKEDLEKNFTDGCILVVRSARADFVDYMKRASAIVSEEAGLTSESAIVAITLGIPTVVGAAHAADNLENGEVVTVDASRGTIFRGEANAR
ncbi:pyruvate kinase [uncultured Megasphaera sp.]|uniref:pyruvate kinase n=1 Tax=uncultured Megasphaera sp. TaxID=165188 RepID=UPI0026DF745E|nr:pyruvate kinase [uncultured Megasphaera sp.]